MLYRVDGNIIRYENGIAEIVVKADHDVDQYGWHVVCAKKIGEMNAWKENDKFKVIIRNWIEELRSVHGVMGLSDITLYNTDWAKVKECADLNDMRDEDVMACLFEYWSEMMKDFEFQRGEFC